MSLSQHIDELQEKENEQSMVHRLLQYSPSQLPAQLHCVHCALDYCACCWSTLIEQVVARQYVVVAFAGSAEKPVFLSAGFDRLAGIDDRLAEVADKLAEVVDNLVEVVG
jgi:hypothetical protein